MFEERLVVINLYISDKRFVLTLWPHALASRFVLTLHTRRRTSRWLIVITASRWRITIIASLCYYILILFMIYLSFEFTL